MGMANLSLGMYDLEIIMQFFKYYDEKFKKSN